MKRLLVLFLIPLLAFGGGAIDFDGDDYYNCGTVSFDTSDDDATFIAWVTPNFASTDTTTKVIFSSIDVDTCPTLPPQCTGVTCGTGYGLFWDGSNTRFSAWFAEDGRCGSGISTFVKCHMAGSTSFAAGDLVGIFANFRSGIQQCQSLIPADQGASGSAFFSQQLIHSSESLLIGAAPAAQTGSSIDWEWDGAIDMIVLGNGRVITLDNNKLSQQHKRSWHPMFTGTHGLNGDGGTDPFEYIFSADMMQANDGDTVSTLRPQEGSTCSSTGDPSATLTRMMY